MSNHKFADTLVFTCTVALGAYYLGTLESTESKSICTGVSQVSQVSELSLSYPYKRPANDPFNLKFPW